MVKTQHRHDGSKELKPAVVNGTFIGRAGKVRVFVIETSEPGRCLACGANGAKHKAQDEHGVQIGHTCGNKPRCHGEMVNLHFQNLTARSFAA